MNSLSKHRRAQDYKEKAEEGKVVHSVDLSSHKLIEMNGYQLLSLMSFQTHLTFLPQKKKVSINALSVQFKHNCTT